MIRRWFHRLCLARHGLFAVGKGGCGYAVRGSSWGDEVAAQPTPAVVDGHRGRCRFVRAEQADKPVAQVLLLQQRGKRSGGDAAEIA